MKFKKPFCLFSFILFALIISVPCFAKEPLQTQMGPKNTEVDLVQAKLNGKVLSITLNVRAPDDDSVNQFHFEPEQIFYIDADQNKKYHILKEEKDKWLAGPLVSLVSPKEQYLLGLNYLSEGESGIIWMKFPAPPGDNPKIEINLPGVVPFSDVEIAK